MLVSCVATLSIYRINYLWDLILCRTFYLPKLWSIVKECNGSQGLYKWDFSIQTIFIKWKLVRQKIYNYLAPFSGYPFQPARLHNAKLNGDRLGRCGASIIPYYSPWAVWMLISTIDISMHPTWTTRFTAVPPWSDRPSKPVNINQISETFYDHFRW